MVIIYHAYVFILSCRQLVLEGPAHVVLAVAAAPGARLARYAAAGAGGGAPLEARPWGERKTYFFTLHDAQRPQPWNITLYFEVTRILCGQVVRVTSALSSSRS